MSRWIKGIVIISICVVNFNVYASSMDCVPGISESTLTASGGATPVVTGQAIDIGRSDGNLSLFLLNKGDSTSISVTYQYGYIKVENESLGTITWQAPEHGGNITNLTALDIHGSTTHEAITVDTTKYIRFTCTNLDAVNTATIALYTVFQEE